MERTSTLAPAQGKFARGRQIAAALAGAWRAEPPPLNLSAEAVARLAPRLLEKGEAGLVYRRLRQSAPQASAPALLQEYRLQTLRAALHTRGIEETAARLTRAGVQPLLLKGWAVARLYPEPGLRPFCDIDWLVPPDQFAVARAALDADGANLPSDPETHSHSVACGPHLVDLHYRIPDLDGRSLEELYDRSRLVPLGATTVRVLGPEDQLRLSAVHFLRHGGWRPLWLCDLALMLEQAGTDFDWDHCLRGSPRQRDWLLCVFHLCQQLLGARLDRVPAGHRVCRPPSWLRRTVLKHWGRPYRGPCERPMTSYVLSPAGLWQALRVRWADPIAVTVRWGLAMNGMPRLPFAIGDYLARAAKMLVRPLRRLRA